MNARSHKQNPQSTANPVPELQELLGQQAVFIDWPIGVKGTRRKWGGLTVADMTPEYLARLSLGNIGVALGEVSGGLCAIDIDRDELVVPFLDANPHLQGTLQTHGARGRVLWLRFTSDYPKHTTKLKTPSGEEAGEFRSNGSQSIVWGIHPDTKQPYQFVVKQRVVEVEFNSIVWPEGFTNKPSLRICTEETEELKLQKNRSTEELKSSALGALPSGVPSLFYSSINTIEDALRVSMPKKKGENNALLFKLARAIKTLEKKGQQVDPAGLEKVFDQWYERARPFLRQGQSREDYFLEFMNACHKAKFPLGGSKVPEAWQKAQTEPLPAEAMKFANPDMRLLIAFLKQMQAIQGTEPFYITYRDAAALLGHKTHTTVATWLGALAQLKYIHVVQQGNERQATRYLYVWRGNADA